MDQLSAAHGGGQNIQLPPVRNSVTASPSVASPPGNFFDRVRSGVRSGMAAAQSAAQNAGHGSTQEG